MRKRFAFPCLLALALFSARPACADDDSVQFGSNIHVAKDTQVHDAVCFFCNVYVDGKVTGDIVVIFGSVHLAGDAQHDVVNIFGGVRAEDNANIQDDLVSVFGDIHLGENVTIGRDLVEVFGSLHAADTVNVAGNRVVQPGWVFWGPFLAICLVIIVIVREVRMQRRKQAARGYPFPPKP